MNPKFQQRHYIALAQLLAKIDCDNVTKKEVIQVMCDYFKDDNERFDERRFKYAIKAYALDFTF